MRRKWSNSILMVSSAYDDWHLKTLSNNLLHANTLSNNLHLDMPSYTLCDNETKGALVIQ